MQMINHTNLLSNMLWKSFIQIYEDLISGIFLKDQVTSYFFDDGLLSDKDSIWSKVCYLFETIFRTWNF